MAAEDQHRSSGRPAKGRSSRGRGRELALWLLCHLESHRGEEREALELFWRERPRLDASDEFLGPAAAELVEILEDGAARRWARRIVDAYVADMAASDAAIEAASRRWRLARMDRVDRNLLRACVVELRDEATPRNVVVAEAVRLAARYGSDRSAVFVNGVAEALARDLRDAAASRPTQAEDEDEDEAEAEDA